MKINKIILTMAASTCLVFLSYAQNQAQKMTDKKSVNTVHKFEVEADRFADLQVLRYQIEGFDELTAKQKELAYYLFEAANSGRDIIYDQKYKYNLTIRKTIEAIFNTYMGNKKDAQFQKFETYAKRVFFSNGIHHHYSNLKFIPECTYDFFKVLVQGSDYRLLPLNGKSIDDFLLDLKPIMYDPKFENKIVDLASGIDNVKASSNNCIF